MMYFLFNGVFLILIAVQNKKPIKENKTILFSIYYNFRINAQMFEEKSHQPVFMVCLRDYISKFLCVK